MTLYNGRHEVTLIQRTEQDDGIGGIEMIAADPVTIRCNIHPLSTEESEAYGLNLTDSYRLTTPAGAWPGQPHDQIIWENETYTQIARTRRSRLGTATQRDRVIIRRGQQ